FKFKQLLEHFGGRRFVEMKSQKEEQDEDEWMKRMQRVMFCALSGISFIHSQGLVVGELCPEVFFISEDGTIKIDTLCLPQIRGNEKSTHATTDSIMLYCAPEVQLGEKPTMRSDIWSLGVIILEGMSNHHPFKGSTREETLMNMKMGRFSEISTFISSDVKELLLMMINVNPLK
ncbi:MAG: hypothetical protein EZS28_048526, partial [Streblomastix strix]